MFDTKVALVTGGSSGIGLAAAKALLREGAAVMVADIRLDRSAVIEELGERAAFVRCDVTIESDVADAVAETEARFGGLDILINNAGSGGASATLQDITVEEWNATFALLLLGPMLGCKHAAPAMLRRGGGAIINTASVAGVSAGWGPLAYSVAKAGVLQLTRVCAAALGRDRIRVNAVLPGLIATGIFAQTEDDQTAAALAERVAKAAGDLQPIPGGGLAEDVAAAMVYLASDAARFVTGAELIIDGGMTTGPRHAWDPATPSPVGQILVQSRQII